MLRKVPTTAILLAICIFLGNNTETRCTAPSLDFLHYVSNKSAVPHQMQAQGQKQTINEKIRSLAKNTSLSPALSRSKQSTTGTSTSGDSNIVCNKQPGMVLLFNVLISFALAPVGFIAVYVWDSIKGYCSCCSGKSSNKVAPEKETPGQSIPSQVQTSRP